MELSLPFPSAFPMVFSSFSRNFLTGEEFPVKGRKLQVAAGVVPEPVEGFHVQETQFSVMGER